jgi:RNA polymerase sigma factor FliA
MNSPALVSPTKGIRRRDLKAATSAYASASCLDAEEREQLLMEQLPQVRYIAKRIHERLPQHVPLEDLVNAGVLGLIEAVHRFDPAKNVELKSYAKHRIQGAILDSLRELDWSPRPLRRKARQIEEANQRLHGRLGRAASDSELAEELGISLTELQQLQADLRGLDLGSLQEEVTDEGNERELIHYLPNSPDEDPFFLCLKSEMKSLLLKAVSELPDRERQLLALYYFEELTMKEVGEVLGVGEARVSQMHSATVLRLRARLRELLASRPPVKPDHGVSTSMAEGEQWRRF